MLNKCFKRISASTGPWKSAIPPPKQRLMFDGKLLDDTRALADYDINSGAVLRLDKMIQILVRLYKFNAVDT